jgi:hypothetical protein
MQLFIILRSDLQNENGNCRSNCQNGAYNANGNGDANNLSSSCEAARLAKVFGEGVLLLLHVVAEAGHPLNVVLINFIGGAKSLWLVSKSVSDVSVSYKLGKHVITTGRKSCIIKSVYIFGNAAYGNAEFLAAKLFKLNVGFKKFFVIFSSHLSALPE